ncbi:nitroreductase family protein [Dysgonomonas sp. 25]|uniref:nitroreductase family protein n=1 Tax=Dysgonomonas sp. 25 TaxID=2302933 RepID=UPI0013D19DC6|nr:nitroreductase family protein [Dysgonomonas sp. 25]NDV67301.1 nitroreductase family protein [Dysgonomonas sp. 25]
MRLKKVTNPANEVFEKRCSIRKYDPSVKISHEEMSNIIQDAMTAPSSLNLQPWRFVVVDSAEGKELVKPYMAFNQLQHETSSALIVVYADMASIGSAESILSADVKLGIRDEANKEKFLQMITSYRAQVSHEQLLASQMLDCGFVCMQLMLSAKAYGYDTNPIGGFDREGISKALGMDSSRYFPTLIISIGKAAEAPHDTTRYSVDEVTYWK